MQYSAAGWAEAEDIDSSINRLHSDIVALGFDALHASVYDTYYCFDEQIVQQLCKDAAKYQKDAEICVNYMENIINFEQFCNDMQLANCGKFLHQLARYLPSDIALKYNIVSENSSKKKEFEDIVKC